MSQGRDAVASTTDPDTATDLDVVRRAAADALVAPGLAHVVDLVAWVEGPLPEPGSPAGGGDDPRVVVVAAARGEARLLPDGSHEVVRGVDPVADEDPMGFLPYERELADPSPEPGRNAYPYARTRLLSFFADADRSPDLAVVHTPRHFFPDEGGHVGEHGSLDVVQSRAPFLLSGAGVPRRGVVADHARLVDVGVTLAYAAGVPQDDLVDGAGRPLDGLPRTDLVAAPRPGERRPVVGLLWDGAHCGDLLHLAAAGELPNVARLLARGTALEGGAVAEFPSITLTNHTSLLTGVGPGRHGVLGNVFYDRATGERVVPNDATTWHRSAEWLRPGTRTLFEMVGDHRPGETTASVDEAVDRGASYSTMALVRASGSEQGAHAMDDRLPCAEDSAYVGERAHLADGYFAWGSRVDDLGLAQVLELFADPASAPALTWWATVVTDAGHHAGGPRSPVARDALRDTDRRLGVFLDHLETVGLTDAVTVVLTADHGFETTDPSCTGSWAPALHAALDPLGVPWRDEGPGLVYLGVAPASGDGA